MARLWHEAGVFDIGDLWSRSSAHADEAARFVGAGRPLHDLAALAPADLHLVSTPDDALADTAAALAAAGVIRAGDVVFHASGATASTALAAAREAGAVTASLHPVLSFASPERAVAGFAGTWVAAEGEAAALAVLRPAFAALGARLFDIDAAAKPVYHAAAVLACNYLPALLEASLRAYGHAGVDRATAMAVLEPIVRGTVDNLFRLGPARALSGPVARGDAALVARQLAAVAGRDALLGRIYRDLGRIAVDLSREQGNASGEALDALARTLSPGPEA